MNTDHPFRVIDRAVDIGREAIVLVHGSETAHRELAVPAPETRPVPSG